MYNLTTAKSMCIPQKKQLRLYPGIKLTTGETKKTSRILFKNVSFLFSGLRD